MSLRTADLVDEHESSYSDEDGIVVSDRQL